MREVVALSNIQATLAKENAAVCEQKRGIFQEAALAGGEALSAYHEATGLPWWATISSATVGLRLALLPLQMKQRKAMAALQMARREVKEAQDSQEGGSTDSVELWKKAMSSWVQRSRVRDNKVTGPLWLFTPVFAHLPCFITMMMTVRYMASSPDFSFQTGGLLWFRDLTLPAFDFASLTAPMGPVGVVLPGTLVLLYHYSIHQNFGSGDNKALRLFLEWLTIPMLLVGLQVPHGVFCYWLTSSAFNNVQAPVLAAIAARTATEGPVASTSSPSESLFAKAKELSESGRGEAAVVLDEKGIEALSHQECMAFAKTLAQKKDWKQAHKLFLVAATKTESLESPDYVQAIFWAGMSSARLGLHENALDLFGKVVERDPKNTESMLALASIHKKNGRIEEAREWLVEAAEIDSKVREQFLDPFDKENPR